MRCTEGVFSPLSLSCLCLPSGRLGRSQRVPPHHSAPTFSEGTELVLRRTTMRFKTPIVSLGVDRTPGSANSCPVTSVPIRRRGRGDCCCGGSL